MQTRDAPRTTRGKGEVILSATLDSAIAPMIALFVNAAILIVTAATFNARGDPAVAEIQDAYRLIVPLIGVPIASTVFALALPAAGQNSAVTATLAGQVSSGGLSRAESPPVGFAASSPGCSRSFRRSSLPRSIVIAVSANC